MAEENILTDRTKKQIRREMWYHISSVVAVLTLAAGLLGWGISASINQIKLEERVRLQESYQTGNRSYGRGS